MIELLALDLSLNHTGWATKEDCGVFEPPKSCDRGLPRIEWIRTAIRKDTTTEHTTLVVLEGLAWGVRGRAILDLAGLAMVIRLDLYDRGLPFVDIGPTVLKKFATGHGNAPKEEMLAAAIRKLKYQGHDNNEADALWLLQAALVRYGLPGAVSLPAAQRRTLDTIAWPPKGAVS